MSPYEEYRIHANDINVRIWSYTNKTFSGLSVSQNREIIGDQLAHDSTDCSDIDKQKYALMMIWVGLILQT